jgi:WD40 repeat protein
VRLWNPATGQAIGAPFLPADAGIGTVEGETSVAFSPDGKLLAIATDAGTVRLWNPATRQTVGAPFLAVANGGLIGVAFSPDGTLLATADLAGYVRLWNPATGQAVGAPILAVANGGLNAVAFSPDGKLPSRPPARRRRCSGWRSARMARCWPAPAATAPCGCGTQPPGKLPALPSRPSPAA